jgi:hypothetical protein
MKLLLNMVLAGIAIAAVCLADADLNHWNIREQSTIQKTLTFSTDPMRLVIDNLEGYVHVTGVAGSEVRVTAHKTVRAETDSDLKRANSEVNLQITGDPGTASIYYDAPWRCKNDGPGCHATERRFYEVKFDIDVEVPRGARIAISTVNDGDVRVAQMDGNFDVGNVNGGISMTALSGSGTVHTVNGPIMVRFNRNPSTPSSFRTVNGSIDVYLQKSFSADLLFKTFNGDVFSDFEVDPRPVAAGETEQHDGKFIYRSKGPKSGRVGSGGPELSFDTLNGSIRLHRES